MQPRGDPSRDECLKTPLIIFWIIRITIELFTITCGIIALSRGSRIWKEKLNLFLIFQTIISLTGILPSDN